MTLFVVVVLGLGTIMNVEETSCQLKRKVMFTILGETATTMSVIQQMMNREEGMEEIKNTQNLAQNLAKT